MEFVGIISDLLNIIIHTRVVLYMYDWLPFVEQKSSCSAEWQFQSLYGKNEREWWMRLSFSAWQLFYLLHFVVAQESLYRFRTTRESEEMFSFKSLLNDESSV